MIIVVVEDVVKEDGTYSKISTFLPLKKKKKVVEEDEPPKKKTVKKKDEDDDGSDEDDLLADLTNFDDD